MYQEDNELRIDIVNPFMSELRQWVCRELVKIFPTDGVEIRSDQDHALFNAWTHSSQTELGTLWATERQDLNEKGSMNKVTTTCNALIQVLVQKINTRFGKPQKKFDTFQLPLNGRGWHWFPEDGVYPQPGDFFEIGKRGGQYKHVGVVLDVRGVPEEAATDLRAKYKPGVTPASAIMDMNEVVKALRLGVNQAQVSWITIEAGQGGPSMGFDSIKRKGLRHLDAGLMGWLNIDEYFGN